MEELFQSACDCDTGRAYVCTCCFNPIINFVCQLCREQFENLDKLIFHKRQGHTVAELKGIKFITFEERFQSVCMTVEHESDANVSQNLQQNFEADEPEATIKIETTDNDADGNNMCISLSMIKTELVEFHMDDPPNNFDPQDVIPIPIPVTFEKVSKIDTDTDRESDDPNSVNDGEDNTDPGLLTGADSDDSSPSFSEQSQSNQNLTDAADLLNDANVNILGGLVLKTPSQKSNLQNQHSLKHECTVCKSHYPTKSSLKFHLNSIHGVIIKSSVTSKSKTPRKLCSECPITFANQYRLNQHIKSQHGFKISAVFPEPKMWSEPQDFGKKHINCKRGGGKELSEELKKLIVRLFKEGKKVVEIAKITFLSWSTVKSVIAKWNQYGTVTNHSRSGRPRKTTARIDRQIVQTALLNRRVSLPDLATDIRKQFKINLCDKTIRKRLKEVNLNGRTARM